MPNSINPWKAPSRSNDVQSLHTIDDTIVARYYLAVIRSFADRTTAAVFQGVEVRTLPRTIQPAARRKLMLVDAVTNVMALRAPPGNRLETLKGSRKGQWSIRINNQWRICFRWQNGHAWDVEIVDYH
jgi:proteic killer suppression protein